MKWNQRIRLTCVGAATLISMLFAVASLLSGLMVSEREMSNPFLSSNLAAGLWVPALAAVKLPRIGLGVYAILTMYEIVLYKRSFSMYHVTWAHSTGVFEGPLLAVVLLAVNLLLAMRSGTAREVP